MISGNTYRHVYIHVVGWDYPDGGGAQMRARTIQVAYGRYDTPRQFEVDIEQEEYLPWWEWSETGIRLDGVDVDEFITGEVRDELMAAVDAAISDMRREES